jgi:hypothetical protein
MNYGAMLDKVSRVWRGPVTIGPRLSSLSSSEAFCEQCSNPNFLRSKKWLSCAAAEEESELAAVTGPRHTLGTAR